MFSTENRVGRLIELRIASSLDAEEVVRLRESHLRVIGSLDGLCVVAVDLRRARVFPQPITEALIELMSHLNPRVERSALLLGISAILGLQAERAIQTAGNPYRRIFREPWELEAWLGEVLEEAERHRLGEFLLEGAAAD